MALKTTTMWIKYQGKQDVKLETNFVMDFTFLADFIAELRYQEWGPKSEPVGISRWGKHVYSNAEGLCTCISSAWQSELLSSPTLSFQADDHFV